MIGVTSNDEAIWFTENIKAGKEIAPVLHGTEKILEEILQPFNESLL